MSVWGLWERDLDMRIAVTSTGPTLDSQVEPRFGRCAYFLVVDTESMAFEAVDNPNVALGGGAGIQSAKLLADRGVTAVLTGNCGPNAFATFAQVGIPVYVGVTGSVRDAVERFKAGEFSAASSPNVSSHFGVGGLGAGGGMGRGGGMGMGGGMGRGMGGGMGRGMGRRMAAAGPAASPGVDAADELAELKARARRIEEERRLVAERIKQLEGSTGRPVAHVDADRCTACGACAAVCPVGAIAIAEVAVVDGSVCKGCAVCVRACPTGAISMS